MAERLGVLVKAIIPLFLLVLFTTMIVRTNLDSIGSGKAGEHTAIKFGSTLGPVLATVLIGWVAEKNKAVGNQQAGLLAGVIAGIVGAKYGVIVFHEFTEAQLRQLFQTSFGSILLGLLYAMSSGLFGLIAGAITAITLVRVLGSTLDMGAVTLIAIFGTSGELLGDLAGPWGRVLGLVCGCFLGFLRPILRSGSQPVR